MARFRTRARAVDMLGRQQIAGVPTAISELFKNAHDAYADNVIVDYYRSDRLFVLRDDGLGMTLQEFEDRWLTLATESKVIEPGAPPPSARPGYPRRAILGEKGIGRLAVAAVGPQALILSRPMREGSLGEVLVCLVHWGFFEIPGVNLDEIEIPTLTIPGGRLPNAADVGILVDWLGENLATIQDHAPRPLLARIRAELGAFREVHPDVLTHALEGPSLLDGSGTHFYISPADPLITADLAARDRGEPSDLLKSLIGFTNTMTPNHRPPALDVEFRDHYSELDYDNIVGGTEFFTPQEFEAADHRIRGEFDHKGQFSGFVRVYDSPELEVTIPFPSARGSSAACGPFQIDVAYQQGERNRTLLDPETYASVNDKLKLYGGLYIYRDGIRVLPYGNQDFDFLEFEARRSKSASDYFFSYRRMFGVVEITREHNSELREKAGREGFAANEAYRQFRDQLKNLFYQVAFQFFRKSGSHSQPFWERTAELDRLDKARQRRARQVSTRRRQVADGLSVFEEALDDRSIEEEAAQVIERLRRQVQSAVSEPDPSRAAAAIADAEDAARANLRVTGQKFYVDRPRGMALSKPLARRYARYEDARAVVEREILGPAEEAILQVVEEALGGRDLALARQLRLESAVNTAAKDARDRTRSAQRLLNERANATQKMANELGREHFREVSELVAEIQADLARLDAGVCSDSEVVDFRGNSERRLRERSEGAADALNGVGNQLAAVTWPSNGGAPESTILDQVEALESQVETLAEQAEDQLELTQVGMAVEIINHEFRQTVQSIRRTLRQIKVWADANPKLRASYEELKSGFDHLDGYLALFTPLQRRLHQSPVEMTGSEIHEFLTDLFEKRLHARGVELEATAAFRRHRVSGYPSTLYPVFVNLVDNALFWMTDYVGNRVITLDAGDGWMDVSDTGPGVPVDLGEDIFKPRVSTKPGGSGYGLFVARRAVERDRMSLVVLPHDPDEGARFRILERSA